MNLKLYNYPTWIDELTSQGRFKDNTYKIFKPKDEYYFISQNKNIQNLRNSFLFTFEGLPGAGKTHLVNNLTFGRKKRFPVKQIIGSPVDFNNDEDFYFASDNEKSSIFQTTKQGLVLQDRDFTGSLAYYYSSDFVNKTNEFSRIFEKYRSQIGNLFLLADKYFYIDIDAQLSLSRKNRQETLETLWNNIKALDHMRNFYQEFYSQNSNIIDVEIINGKESFENIYTSINKTIENYE